MMSDQTKTWLQFLVYNQRLELLFEIATTRAGSRVALINQTPQTQDESEASEQCSWWRRGRVEPGLKHGLVVLVAINQMMVDHIYHGGKS